jgi:Ca2+/Na+ antiporter
MSDAFSAIAITLESGFPDIAVGNIDVSTTLNFLIPFTFSCGSTAANGSRSEPTLQPEKG